MKNGRKIFNTTGPCYKADHYMLPTEDRINNINDLIEDKSYFVIHAPRQVGKTTFLQSLEESINKAGEYYAIYVSLETVQGIDDIKDGITAILRCIDTSLKYNNYIKNINKITTPELVKEYSQGLQEGFSGICSKLDKPLIVLFDEADCLSNGTLINFLRQLRNGYINRNKVPFIQSLALVGMRNIRDYKAKIREFKETVGSASPFNIVVESLSIRNFNLDEIKKLYAQHTELTGQIFTDEVSEQVFYWTDGQPWLVNAIAREIIVKVLERDNSKSINVDIVNKAAKNIIIRRDTHIDSLLERLKEERVRRVIEPLILGRDLNIELIERDDLDFVLDLGLLKRNENKSLIPANRIYAEVLFRTLAYGAQLRLETGNYTWKQPLYLQEDGSLDMDYILKDFQKFWRENGEIWIEKYQYKEAAPHLVLQAFLQRIINGGGSIIREAATGKKRLDLVVNFGKFKYVIELKLRYSDKTKAEGINQLTGYLEDLGETKGWLIIFDRRKTVNWDNKCYWEELTDSDNSKGKQLTLIGC